MRLRPEERVIVALDTLTAQEALTIVDRLGDGALFYKVGMALFAAEGPELVREVRSRGKKVFVDLKFHDIPHQVGLACRAVTRLGASLMNVHALAGREALSEAAEAVADEAARERIERPGLVAVTILTSLADLKGVGGPASRAGDTIQEQVVDMARLARQCGLDGVVCSGHEVEVVKSRVGSDCLTVVPGVRPVGTAEGDQRRVLTPGDAVRRGADYLVVGRPITEAEDPCGALAGILEEIEDAAREK